MAKFKLTVSDEDKVLLNFYPAQPEDGYEEGTKVTINVKYGPVGNRFGTITGGDYTEIIDKAVYEVTMDSAKSVTLTKEGEEPPVPVGDLEFSASGSVPYGSSVSLICNLENATVWYTEDGSEPIEGKSPVWNAEKTWTVTSNLTLKALAKIEVSEGTYSYKSASTTLVPVVNAPVITPAETLVEFGDKITISTDIPGAEIHYTLDGTDPTASSEVYTTPISVENSITVKAIALVDGLSSAVASKSYTVKLDATRYRGWLVGAEGAEPPVVTIEDLRSLSGLVTDEVSSCESPDPTIYVATEDVVENGGRTVWAYPSSLGECSKIVNDLGTFPIANSYTLQKLSLGKTEYNVYILTGGVGPDFVGQEYPNRFIR